MNNKKNSKEKEKKMDYPKTLDITNSKEIRKEISERKVILQEIIKGHSMIIHFSSEKDYFFIDYQKDEEPKVENAFVTLDANCNEKEYDFHKIMTTLKTLIGAGSVDFTVFGEFVDKDTQALSYIEEEGNAILYVYDIYVNKNWMCQDDIDYICKKAGLIVGPKLAQEVFNETTIQRQFTAPSMANKNIDHKHSIIVKPYIEDNFKNNRIALYYTHNKYLKTDKAFKKKDETITNKVYEEIAKNIIDKNVTEEKLSLIEKEARRKYDFKVTDKGIILSFSVNRIISLYLTPKIYTEIFKYFKVIEDFREVEGKVIGNLKKKLPYIFMKRYDFK